MITHFEELTRRAQRAGTDDWTAAAMRLCGLALDAGLVSLPDLQAAVNGCRTREELTPTLQAILLGLNGEGGRP